VTWAVVGTVLVAVVVLVGLVLAVRAARTQTRGGSAPAAPRADRPGSGVDRDQRDLGVRALAVDLDLGRHDADPLAPIPDDQAVLDADAGAIDLTRGPTVRVVLHPGPVTRRRLAGRPDALVVVADAEALDVPGWIVEDRSRTIDRMDRVVIPWGSIERFRVRAQRDGPGVYDITGRAGAPPPQRWRVRRDEIANEIELLDHVRRIGRITIELEDSIRS
jgi:hypothetical protein